MIDGAHGSSGSPKGTIKEEEEAESGLNWRTIRNESEW